MDDTSPIPSRDVLQEWLNTVATDVQEGRVSAVELAEQLADVRRAARDLGQLADWLLLAAREQGAGLPVLAAAWGLRNIGTETGAKPSSSLVAARSGAI